MREAEYYNKEEGTSSYLVDGEWHSGEPSPLAKSADLVCLHRLDGLFHKEDGPALVKRSGSTQWSLHGVPHRTDGPAIEHSNGRKEWYLKGKKLSEAEFLEQCKK